MYASDLLNKDKKITKYYFGKGGRQISLSVYTTHFTIAQLFDKGKVTRYSIDSLSKAIDKLTVSSNLLETIRYR